MSKPKAYAYTSSAIKFWRQNATMILTWSNFFANRAIYGVKDSWKLLIITNQGNEWQNVILVKEGCFSGPQTLIIALSLFPLNWSIVCILLLSVSFFLLLFFTLI